MEVTRTKSYQRKLFDTKVPREYDRPLEYTPNQYLTPQKTIPTIGFDPQMEVTPYSEPVIMAHLQTIATSILRLMYTVPGQFPDYPNMGIDIRKYLFSFEDEFTAARLRQEIVSQIPLLGEYVANSGTFEVRKTMFNNKMVVIISLLSTVKRNNGMTSELRANIGLTFDDLHALVSDIVFAYDGMKEHFTPRIVVENPLFNVPMRRG